MKLSQNELNIAILAINNYIEAIEPLLEPLLGSYNETESFRKAYKKVINDLRKQTGKEELK